MASKTVGIIKTSGMTELRTIPDGYEGLRDTMGGLVQALNIPHFRGAVWVDEEGLLKRLPLNRALYDAYGLQFAGDAIVHFSSRDTTQADIDTVLNPKDAQRERVFKMYNWSPF